MKDLLKTKQEIKAKMPKFVRTAGQKKARLKRSGWRRPKGITNKMRLQEHGYRAIVKKGYRTPADIRDVERDGKTKVIVCNVADLKKVGKTQKALISSQVGLKKKAAIIEEAKKQKIEISNYMDAEKSISQRLEKINAKKAAQKEKREEREKKKESAEKKKEKEDKKSVEEKVSDEDRKKEEKKEKDSVLIHKE